MATEYFIFLMASGIIKLNDIAAALSPEKRNMMKMEFFTLHSIPDLTLAKYSVQESGGVGDVLRQHLSFYRQLNRRGLLFDEIYQLIYFFDPAGQPGKRLTLLFGAGGESGAAGMEEFLEASSLSAYFRFEKEEGEACPSYAHEAALIRQDGFVPSSFPERETGFYMVDPWKGNDRARLMGLFRMMQKMKQRAAYVVTIKAADMAQSMRESFRTQIQFIRNAEKLSQGRRDENAEQCLRGYQKFLENLRSTPHFLCSIRAYADSEAFAKMILDAAASEAVEEGSYRIACKEGRFLPLAACEVPGVVSPDNVPRGMRRWNSLYLLKEMAPFAMFPVLYPGEDIEIPKESAPIYERDGLYLGEDRNGYGVYVPLRLLPKHGLIAGVPGSGKTYSMLHIISQLGGAENRIPVLVLEPAKKEYRALAQREDMPDFMVFSPGAAGRFPLRINPFEFPLGLKLSEHITNLNQVFEGAFDLEPPMPFLVSEGIEKVYRDRGWYPFEVNDGTHTYPNMTELYHKLAEILEASDYAPEVKSNLKSCLQVRIGSLVTREMGNVFDVPGSTLSPEEWLKSSCVIELESLGADAANFLTLLLLTIIREMLRQNPGAPKDKPRHVIFLEEAHNLIGPATTTGGQGGDAKVASTKYIVDMLAEVRALQEAIIIADQLPTALAAQVTKNTSLKIGHRITAMDDRELLASTMSADGVQLERMASFLPGHALCVYENIQKPFEIKIAEYSGESEPPSAEKLFELFSERDVYRTAMERDFEIMSEKFRAKGERIERAYRAALSGKEVLSHNRELLAGGKMEAADQRKARAVEIQYLRNLRALSGDWLEYILELMDYCGMNRLMRERAEAFLYAEMRVFTDGMKELLRDCAQEHRPILESTLGRMAAKLADFQRRK